MATFRVNHGPFGWSNERVSQRAPLTSEKVRHTFMSGQCHSLALAIHEETGWPLYGLGREWEIGHVVVESPRGFLDIQGLNALARWQKIWGEDEEAIPLEVEDVRAPLEGYHPPQVEDARPFARRLLRREFPELFPRSFKRTRKNLTTFATLPTLATS
jgi:hypothetical protein